MAMVVRSNLMAYNANRQLGMNNSAVSKNLEKLSSGFKINRAADDAAGLAVSEKMKAQIKGLEQASLNSQDGISLVQTAEGALTEVHDMLNRMTELATKSANGTIQNEVDREAIQNEVNKLNDEIDRIADSTNFNGIKLLNGELSGGGSSGGATKVSGSAGGTAAAGGAAAGGAKAKSELTFATVATNDTFTVDMEITVDGSVKKISYSGTATGTDITAEADFIKAIEDAVGSKYTVTGAGNKISIEAKDNGADKSVSIGKASWTKNGAAQTATMSTPTLGKDDTITLALAGTSGKAGEDLIEIDGQKFQLAKHGDEILDGYKAIYTDDGKMANATQQASVVKQLQDYGIEVTANTTATSLDFKAAQANATGGATGGGLTLQIGDTGDNFNQVSVSIDNMGSKGIGTNALDVSTQDAAKAAIQTIKDGINKVSTNRSELGALQNRLEHTINNLDVAAENMTNANSRIRDTDMAKQMMEYTKMNVLTQSAQAMLAQANQNPQSILQLLQ